MGDKKRETKSAIRVGFLDGLVKNESEQTRIAKAVSKRQAVKKFTQQESDKDLSWFYPPYEPENLAKLLEINITHYRACATKASDAAGIGMHITSANEDDEDPPKEEVQKIKDFLEELNEEETLFDILENFVMDYESVGWGCIEVLRNKDGKIGGLTHVPAKDIRRLKNGPNGLVFAQLDETENASNYFIPFPKKYQDTNWVLVDAKTGDPTEDFDASATELIFWKNVHPAVRYYGLPDIIPAVGDICTNGQIKDFFSDFFENNCMARWAVVIKGDTPSEEVRSEIQSYFENEVKGSPHRTIVMEVDHDTTVEFNRLDAEQKEGDFRETRKDLRDFVLLCHGLSPGQVGIIEASSLGSGNGSSQAENHLNRIVLPLQRRLHGILDKILNFGLGIKKARIRLIPPDIKDLEIRSKAYALLTERGITNINESRRDVLGKGPVEGGDKHYVYTRATSPRQVGGGSMDTVDSKIEDSSETSEVK